MLFIVNAGNSFIPTPPAVAADSALIGGRTIRLVYRYTAGFNTQAFCDSVRLCAVFPIVNEHVRESDNKVTRKNVTLSLKLNKYPNFSGRQPEFDFGKP